MARTTQLTPAGETVAVGDIVSVNLVTDTLAYEVIAISPSGKTLTLRGTVQGDVVKRIEDGTPYQKVLYEALPSSNGETITARRNKHGFFIHPEVRSSFHPIYRVDGKPVTLVDYSF